MPDDGRAHPLARSVLFMLWAFVFWGTLTLVAIAWRTFEIGLFDTLRRLLFGTPGVPPTLGRFSLVCAVVALATWTTVAWMLALGLLASWLGTLWWNAAARRLPTSLAGQLIVFETLSALAYAWLLRRAWPDPATLAGVGLLVTGVVLGVRAFAQGQVSRKPQYE